MPTPKCPVCGDDYQVAGGQCPVVIGPCGHTCCYTCLSTVIHNSNSNQCTICGKAGIFTRILRNILMIEQLHGEISEGDFSVVRVEDKTMDAIFKLLKILARLGFLCFVMEYIPCLEVFQKIFHESFVCVILLFDVACSPDWLLYSQAQISHFFS